MLEGDFLWQVQYLVFGVVSAMNLSHFYGFACVRECILMACTIFVELYIRCASVQNRGRDGRWFVRYGTALVIVLWNALGSCFFLGMIVCMRSIVFCISWFVCVLRIL